MVQILWGALFAAGIALLSHRLRLLTLRGSIAQFAVGWLLFGLGAWQWTVPIVVFFVLSSILSHVTHAATRSGSELFAKGGTRDELQVAANGGVAAALAVPWFFTGMDVFFIGYLGAVGASAADTWATEFGMTSPRAPRSIRTLRTIVPGQSGGITPRGLLAGAVGALAITISGLPWLSRQDAAAVAVGVMAWLACLLDSLLGATLQMQFRCVICGRLTERSSHCGVAGVHASGLPWLTNDSVNLIASTAGGGGAMVLYLLVTGTIP